MMILLVILIGLQIQWQCGFCLLARRPQSWAGQGREEIANLLAAEFIPHRHHQHGRRLTSRIKMQQNSLTTPPRIIANSPEMGGEIIRILNGPDEDEDVSFLNAMRVPTFAVCSSCSNTSLPDDITAIISHKNKPKRLGLEAILRNPNYFVLEDALSFEACESILDLCENQLKFGRYNAGKNNHGAMQIVIPKKLADSLSSIIGPHVDLEAVAASQNELRASADTTDTEPKYHHKRQYALTGINRRFRIYRYSTDQNERFAPHIDAGFPPGGVSLDDDKHHTGTPYLYWDASHQYPPASELVSRLTVLIYLNEDFSGGQTTFYEPLSERGGFDVKDGNDSVIASVKPRAGSILVFPQAVSEPAVERARYLWPLHEGSPVISGKRAKYVIRTDVLFETILKSKNHNTPEEDLRLFQHDNAVRNVFLSKSPLFSELFLRHTNPLYNPHMGVENAGPLLYSLVRFTKSRNIVEVGAGYTTLFLLQALRDNDDEMRRVVDLDTMGQLKLLDYPFGTPRLKEWISSPSSMSSSLVCIDNCKHQRETASGVVHAACLLGLDSYLRFCKEDAFDALNTNFSQIESIDFLWCDFGVGPRMTEYASKVWKFIRPGGFMVCHSTLTNTRTREWLEGVRQGKGIDETGIPVNEYAELSLLEPHKRFQNSLTILQKRAGKSGEFSEPLYSEFA